MVIMKIIRTILLYLKHITFIGFLYAGILLYPGLIESKIGICCLVFFIVYSIVTFLMFFVKSKGEQDNSLNNFVMSFLHLYFMFITYRYTSSIGLELVNESFFPINYFIASLSMFILSANKFILWFSK